MRLAKVLFKEEEAGLLTQFDDGSFSFRYHVEWIANPSKQSISLTLPKEEKEFHDKTLFPFFYNLLPEGPNREFICKINRMEIDDYFGLLMLSAKDDSIGAVKVIKWENA